tara:strand:+ start:64504 stop:64923 length:420 start_codon:yes stop_codon:yes gene_type:complete
MKISDKIIEEIADNLDSGMRCYLHMKTGDLKIIINEDKWIGADTEAWEDDIEEIDSNWTDYIEFEGMDSHESFKIMVDFTENVDNEKLQYRLKNALNKLKPFQNFKWEIDNSGDYRQEWFDFKKMRYIEYVKRQIELID